MQKHISIHPITKERFVDSLNIDRIRYYRLSEIIRDYCISIICIIMYAYVPGIQNAFSELSYNITFIIGLLLFILFYVLIFIVAFRARGNKLGDSIKIAVKRHVSPIFITFTLSTFYHLFGFMSIEQPLHYAFLHFYRLMIITGIIVFSITYYGILKDLNKK